MHSYGTPRPRRSEILVRQRRGRVAQQRCRCSHMRLNRCYPHAWRPRHAITAIGMALAPVSPDGCIPSIHSRRSNGGASTDKGVYRHGKHAMHALPPFIFTKQREISVSDERNKNKPGVSRRGIMKGVGAAVGGAALIGATPSWLRSPAWAAGSDKPEKTDLTIGFIPLTDCASVVMAYELGLYKKYGLIVTVSKEASWAAVRGKLVHGELDAAHVLYGLIYGVHLGTSGPQKDMAVLMNLNNNGQAITLSKQLKDKGVTDGASLKKLVDSDKRDYTFAQTFPTGTHAMWLYYWLAANGIHPFNDVKTIVVPPPQMVANMRVGSMDGFCVGEPWNARAIFDKIGFTAITTLEIWKDHPEKVLGTTAEFVLKYPNTTRAMLMAVMEASIYIDATANRA